MLKKIRKGLAIVLALCIALLPVAAIADGVATSDQQIKALGGEDSYEDGEVKVSKTIAPTSKENEFDITLKVDTSLAEEENWTIYPDAAVALTIDMSGTMYNNKMDGKRYVEVAKAKAKEFVEAYAASSENGSKRMIAVAAFDTDAKVVQNWVDVATSDGKAAALNAISNIKVADNGSTSSNQVCTNFDGGVVLTRNLLANSGIDKKYRSAIILSDGAPTVTISGDTSAVGTIKSTFWGSQTDANGVEYTTAKKGGGWTHPGEVDRTYGYMQSLKSKANIVKIIGVGGDMGITLFKDAVTGYGNGKITKNSYDYIEPLKSRGITGDDVMKLTTADWLELLVGGGNYVSATNTAGLKEQFDSIINSIEEQTSSVKTEAWIVEDPMGEYIDFMDFTSVEGDKVSFADGKITWDLKNSEFTEDGDRKIYTITYRVRLENEADGFVEKKNYDTNGKTTFTYQTLEEQDGIYVLSEDKTVDFSIPAVEGYLSEFSFTKEDNKGNKLEGAEFELKHAAGCNCSDVTIAKAEATSDADGKVSFANIPSGHEYVLAETKSPEGYVNSEKTYKVVVAYDEITIKNAAGTTTIDTLNVTNDKLGELTIEKQIAGDLEKKDFAAKAFTFKVTGEDYEETVKLPTEDGKWSVTLEGLKAGDYTVLETEAGEVNNYSLVSTTYDGVSNAEGATVSIANKDEKAVVVVNEYEYVPRGVKVTATKIWDDGNNQDGNRPDAVRFALYEGEKLIKEQDVTTPDPSDPNKFTTEFMYDANLYPGDVTAKEIGYYVGGDYIEGIPAGYDDSVDGTTVTNTYVPETIDIAVEKVWEVPAGVTMPEVTINLLANGNEVDQVKLNAETGWTYTFEGLAKYAGGVAINYTVTEDEISDSWKQNITHVGDEWLVTNTYTTTFTVEKVWDDNRDAEDARPDSIKVQLTKDGAFYKEATLSEENDWTYTWKDLPYDAVYAADETEVPAEYTKKVDTEDGKSVITNKFIPRVAHTVVKVWEDVEDYDQIRPEGIMVQLTKDGQDFGEAVELNARNRWTYTWEKLVAGHEYAAYEVSVPEGYTHETDTLGATTTITNTHVPVTEHTVVKVWDDGEDKDQLRPESIEAQLMQDGQAYGEVVVLSEDNQWTYTWTELIYGPEYTVVEVAVPEGYTAETETANGVTTITNTHAPIPRTTHTVAKVWVDENNADQLRPESIEVQLMQDGQAYGEPVVLSEDNQWVNVWSELPLGPVYTAVEVAIPEGYTAETVTEEAVTTITNTHVPAPELTAHTVIKIWDDEDDQDQLRPESIRVQLMQDGANYGAEVVLTAETAWTYTWNDLPLGPVYTAVEVAIPEGYTAETETMDLVTMITNTHTPPIEGEEEEEELEERPNIPGEITNPEFEIDDINKVTVKKNNTETILDEEVPLAAAPKTGDNSYLLIVVIAIIAMALAATFIFEKKSRKNK